MKNASFQHLQKIIDLDRWQCLQDSLAKVTGMAIITVDYKGVPITKHSNCQKFCKLVRADEVLSKHCQRCDSRGGLDAVRLNRPYVYLCHYNIVDAAIPILVDGKYLGAIMVGQVILPSKSDAAALEPIDFLSSKERLAHQTEKYNRYFNDLPRMSFMRVKMIVDMLFHLCNYIVDEAIEKNLALEMCADFTARSPTAFFEDLPGYPVKSMENIRHRLNSAITDAHISETAVNASSGNRILSPAFLYINEHKSEPCSLKTMAGLCHVSPGYFGRLFARETGENYSIYLARLRIKWAKQLLEATDKTISQISNDIGFNDAGYFIKVFKKTEGVTPSLYRKYYGIKKEA